MSGKRKKIRTKETDENRDVSRDHDVTLARRSLSLLPPCVTYFLFFTLRVTHCRVESKFLTLKILCKGTTKLLEIDGGTEVDRIEGSMTQRIEKIERERARESKRGVERGERSQSAERTRERRKKNRRLKGRITSGILVFAFHLDQSRFPDFPSFRRQEPPLELDVHCTSDETRRDSSSAPTS